MSLQCSTAPQFTRRALFSPGLHALILVSGCAQSGSSASKAPPAQTEITENLPPASRIDASLQEATRQLTYKCAQLWGTSNARLPAQKTWTSYDDDWHSRGDIDFENAEFRAQVIVDANSTDDIAKALTLLRKRLADAQNDTPSDMAARDAVMRRTRDLAAKRNVAMEAPPSSQKSSPSVLAGVLPENAADKLTSEAVQRTPILGDDGKPRIMLTYRVPFLDDYRAKLTAPHIGTVRTQSEVYGLPPSLILAVIESESAFNPRARSGVPAYGLMQIVPQTAGRDASAFADGTARDFDPEYLYNSGHNIHLGTAYLKLLESRYLRDIDNPVSRRYGAIAGYNTGAGNVARAFNATTNMASAARIINQLASDEVLRRLREQLPYEETRNYIVAVLSRQDRYRSMDPITEQTSTPR
jgi:membrane-bound lytic murein transglycosylase C